MKKSVKLLLVEDVEHLGRSGDVVTVRPGYARNCLVPEKYAVPADKRALRMQTRLQEERRKRASHDRKEAEELAALLEGVSLSTTVKVDPEGHMYGSVSAADLTRLLHEQNGIELDRHLIQLKHPLKALGTHTVPVRLKEDVQTSFTVDISQEL